MIGYDRDGEGKMRKRNPASGGFLRKTHHQLLHVTNHCRNFAPPADAAARQGTSDRLRKGPGYSHIERVVCR